MLRFVLAGFLALVLIIVVGMGSLYAFRAHGPSSASVAFSTALTEVQGGQVRGVVIEGNGATLTLNDGSTQSVTLPDGGQTLARAVTDHNRTDPSHPTDLRQSSSSSMSPQFSGVAILIGLLPILLLVALILLGASAFSKSAGRSAGLTRAEALVKLADLRERGALTEDEFQREKRRLLN